MTQPFTLTGFNVPVATNAVVDRRGKSRRELVMTDPWYRKWVAQTGVLFYDYSVLRRDQPRMTAGTMEALVRLTMAQLDRIEVEHR